jgi:L-Lysine epsilon oxidase N-terminal/L-lysine epsilon oxidase C-terminal domain
LRGEVSEGTRIDWTVDLANRKAALDRQLGPARPRNVDVADRHSLVIQGVQPVTISGPAQPAAAVQGRFLGTDVYLGEVRTDAQGRLLVLGGRGVSGSVPPGAPLTSFANNDRWHDDVSDGPVTAMATPPGGAPAEVAESSWVIVAPPDFAPRIDAIVSLYDITTQAAIDGGTLVPQEKPSFSTHIRPMIERIADMRWVDSYTEWQDLQPLDWSALADPSAVSRSLRQRVAGRIRQPGLARFHLPTFLRTYLDQWVAGDFVSDLGSPPPDVPLPEQLDRAALERSSGNNFFPGIEGGQNLQDPALYGRPYRLDSGNPTLVFPGCLSEVMAVPWQADFRDCDGGVWWPTQRPDMVMTDAADIPGSEAEWENPIQLYREMVENVQRLGFVVPQTQAGQTVFVEKERDPTFHRQ